MEDILKLLKNSSPALIILVFLVYFLKVFFDKRLEGIAGRIEEINKTSLEVKKELRVKERDELVAFRVAVEKWEYFLQTALFDFTMESPLNAKVSTLFEKDKELFLDVRISIVKACTFLRNEDLEKQLMDAVLKIRHNYYPIINNVMPRLIDINAKLMLFETKLNKFQQSGMQDMSFAPTENDREEYQSLQSTMTSEMEKFSDSVKKMYETIAGKMIELKEAINHYIYRPIKGTDIDKD